MLAPLPVTYRFGTGTQNELMPNPGVAYSGTSRAAYYPDSPVRQGYQQCSLPPHRIDKYSPAVALRHGVTDQTNDLFVRSLAVKRCSFCGERSKRGTYSALDLALFRIATTPRFGTYIRKLRSTVARRVSAAISITRASLAKTGARTCKHDSTRLVLVMASVLRVVSPPRTRKRVLV